MTQTVIRLYSTYQQATDAVGTLKAHRFSDDQIHLITQSDDYLLALLAKAGLSKTDSAIYADGVRRGGSLVGVAAPFGSAAKAIYLLDKTGPVYMGVSDSNYLVESWSEPAPFSRVMQLDVLSDNATPISRMFGLPTLTKSGTGLFGLPTLGGGASPLSSMLGLPTLLKGGKPLLA